jgi:hypothetical protein
MALEGKIVDFGVADILQLISQQQKTGVLIVEKRGESIEVLFWNGMIISAHPVAKAEKELLGEKLVKSGLITSEQLERALNFQQQNFQHLGEILVEMNFLGKDQLDKIIQNQIYDTFAELFQWKEGSYAFEATPVNFNEKVFTPLGLEHIILDVLRMMDELPDIMKSIHSMDTLFKKTEREFPGTDPNDNGKMSYEEEIVFNLIDGQNTVQDVVDKSLLGKYAASKTMMHFLENDYIEIVHYDVSDNLQSNLKNHVLGKHVLTFLGYTILAVLAGGFFSVSPPNLNMTFMPFIERFNPPIPSFNQYDQIKAEKVKNGLKVYFWENGRYPEELKDLVAAHILRQNEITNGRGALFSYRSNGSTYFLE